MMLLITLVVITQSFGIQGAVDIVLEDTECPFYDKEYFLEPEVFVNNQNQFASNITIIKQLPIETQGHLTILAASMGEYVVSTGIDQTVDLCDIMEDPIVSAPFLSAIGFSQDHCPPEIGHYGTEGYVLDPEALADRVPPNQYMLNITLSYEEKILLLCQSFIKVN
ncbi:uncharacterized protein LOC130671222 [Microplitis mediator]|uniref:uncharacterized protein LOC130671222 n=1 Tax=Microplitis mediator TaxID=375433 RepID=UPI00255557BA|nr:uncharacterized protein LOC130671222 [Microplitis mediator]